MHRFWQSIPWLSALQTQAKEVKVKEQVPCTLEGLTSLLDLFQQVGATTADNWNWISFVEDDFVEAVRRLSELIVWGETHDARFLELFCKRRVLADFVYFLAAKTMPLQVKVQLLQTLSIIVPNVKSSSSLHSLLDGNLINEVIMVDLDFGDEEILTWYISFLKSLALRLNSSTIRFFFDPQRGSFPLYTQAARFSAHPDLMVRTSVRTLTLRVFTIEDDELQSFLVKQVAPTFSDLVAVPINDAWGRLEMLTRAQDISGISVFMALSDPASSSSIEGLRDALQDEMELLEYVGDLHSAARALLKLMLTRCVLYKVFFPLIGCLQDTTSSPAKSDSRRTILAANARRLSSNAQLEVAIPVALYALMGVARVFGAVQQIIEPIARILLWPSISVDLRDAILTPRISTQAMEAALNSWQILLASETPWDQSVMLVKNPFRATLVALLGSNEKAAASPLEESHAVKALLYQLELAPALPSTSSTSLLEDLRLEPGRSMTTMPTTPQDLEETPCAAKPGASSSPAHSKLHHVFLECVQAVGVRLEEIPSEHRTLVLRSSADVCHGMVGRQHQPEVFHTLVLDKQRLMSISRTHFELSWTSPLEPLLLRKISSNPLYLEDCIVETGVVVSVSEGATISFQCLADATIFLSFRLSFNSQVKDKLARSPELKSRPKRLVTSPKIAPEARSQLAAPASPPELMFLECSLTMGIELARIPTQARYLAVDMRHRTILGRQYQPGFFENLLQGAPHYVQYLSRAHIEVASVGPPWNMVKLKNLSINTIFVDGKPVVKGDVCHLQEGSVLDFVAAASGQKQGDASSRSENILRFLQFILRRPASVPNTSL